MFRRLAEKCTRAVNSGVNAHLEGMFRFATTRPLRVILLFLALLAFSCLSIATTRFESNLFSLFPSQTGPLRLFLDSMEWTGSIKDAFFILEGDRERLPAEAEAFVDRLKRIEVDGRPGFGRITYRVFDPSEAGAFATFIGYAVTHPQLFLPPDAATEFCGRLDTGSMERSLVRAKTELATQAGMGMRDIIAVDPLYLRDLILPRLKKGSQALDLDPASPYFLSRDGRVLIIIAEPVRTVQDMAFARKLVAGINEARAGAGVRISCTGAHLSAVIDEAEVKGNVIACVVSSLVVVLLLFYLTYRRFLPTLLIPVILLCGVVLALGVAGLFLSSISLISFAFTALIVGLGTDYSIHIYDRFHSERNMGRETREALRLAVIDTGHGVFTAATTTALPFLALTISDVRALFELGLLVGLGVIFSLYATVFLLPPLLISAERWFPRMTYAPLPELGLGRLWDVCGRPARAVTIFSALVIVVFLGLSFFISFEGELKNLQPQHSEAFRAQEKIEKHLGLSPKQMLVAVEGKGLDHVLARGGRVERLVAAYRQKQELSGFSSLGQVLNDRQQQEDILKGLGQCLNDAEPGRSLRTALQRQGFAAAPFEPVLEGLSGMKSAEPVPAVEAIGRIGASPLRGVVDRHLIRDERGEHLLFHLYYTGGEFPQERFLRDLAEIDPTARTTSADLVSRQLASSVERSFLWGLLLGGALVLFLLLSHFETLAGMAYSLFPVLAGVIAMLGLMVVTGMRLNFMNSMVLVTILGMGSDYGLHIAHRVKSNAPPERRREFVQAARAVLLSALTTIAGFGSLAFTDYGALASIGWATIYGVFATALFALVSLPALMALSGRRP